jgi:hypothetical protein
MKMTLAMIGHLVIIATSGLIAASSATAEPARSPSARAGADLDCVYASRARNEVLTFRHCAWAGSDGHPHVTRRHLRDLSYDRYGLSTILIGRWYVTRRDGQLAPVMMMDNWAEDFSSGLARSPVGGKIGFIDRSLKLAIPARYDGAYPFDHGVATVCTGCTSKTVGEHSSYVGGSWGCIDRSGRLRQVMRPLKPGEGVDGNCRGSPPAHDWKTRAS